MRSLRRTFAPGLGLALMVGTLFSIRAADGPPIILTPPANVTVPVGAPAAFTVGVDGTRPFTYQWLRNGGAIPDATNDFYSLPAASVSDDNAVFAAQVTNPLGNITSSNAVLRVLVPVTIGATNQPGSITNVTGGFNVAGGGADIGGTADQLQFNYEPRSGDFDVRVRLEGVTLSDVWAKAGLMARETLAANGRYVAGLATPSLAGCSFQARNALNGQTTNSGAYPINYPNTWLRLTRAGNVFSSFAGFDGASWSLLGIANIPTMTNTVLLGVAVSSHNTNQLAVAQFRSFENNTNTAAGGLPPNVEPAGPSSRKTPFAITEIMYRPAPRTDGKQLEFIELFNSNPFFEDLSGYQITGDINFTFPSNTIVPGGAYVVLARSPADVENQYGISGVLGYGITKYTTNVVMGMTNVTTSLVNSLSRSGTLRLRNPEGAILLEVPFSNNNPWPVGADGTGHSLVLARPSYGEGFPQAWSISDTVGGSPGRYDGVRGEAARNVVINEFLAKAPEPLVEYIELYNHGNTPVDLSGCAVSDDPNTNKFALPPGTIILPHDFLILFRVDYEFGLNSGGETIYFWNADRSRLLDAVQFEAQAAGVSFGRYPNGAPDFYPLARRSPGEDNGPILVRDIVINELMYKSISGDNKDQYVELYNKGTAPVNLSGWTFTSGISFTFPTNTILTPDGYLVVAKNAARLMSNYPTLNPANTVGDFGGSLSGGGERVAIGMPDLNVTTNALGQFATNTVYVVVDEVTYGPGGRWPKWANQGGSSMELIDPRSNHRLAANWTDSDETTKAPWTEMEFTGMVDNGATSDSPNNLQVEMLGEGECLLDNVEILGANGVNLLTAANSTFESGLGTWTARGNHVRSTLENNEGYQGGKSFHIRASARGDSVVNRLRVPMTATLSQNQPATIRAKGRWLHGWPELVLRTQGHWIELPGRLTVPVNLGTPGARNSQATGNTGPAIYQVAHTPVLPAANQPVVVTARVHDPDGLSSVVLRYRYDPLNTFTNVIMVDDGTGGDAVAGDGIYSATIPAPNVVKLVAFHVIATDNFLPNASNRFPSDAPIRECLVRFGDANPISSFGVYRFWMTVSNVNSWIQRPVMSNERVEGTFTYGNFRVIYNMGSKYSGSPYHQGFSSPASDGHYSPEFPLDDLLLGTENFNKIHAPGNGPFDDAAIQREQASYYLVRGLGVPWNYRRFVAVYFNGTRRGTLMEDSQTPGTDVLAEQFPNDKNGNLFKLQPWFETDDTVTGSIGFRNVSWCTLNRYLTTNNAVVTQKTGRYRNNYLTRAANGTANDYTNVFQLIDIANAPTNTAAYMEGIESIVDTEEWARIFAAEHAVGNWDSFGSQNAQNMYGYKPQNGKWTLFIWDYNIVLGNSGSWGPGQNLFLSGPPSNYGGGQDLIMPHLFEQQAFRRAYWRGLKDLINGPMLPQNVGTMMDAKFAAFTANGLTGITPPAVIKDWIASARLSIAQQMTNEGGFLPFAITSAVNPDTTNNLIVLAGTAPVEMKTVLITLNGVATPATFATAGTWLTRLILTPGTNSIVVQAYDRFGNAVPGTSASYLVNYSGIIPDPRGAVVFNEIMYNPAVPDSDFVEILNRSPYAFDVSNWRLTGVDFTFPAKMILTNQEMVVLVKNPAVYAAAFGNRAPNAGQFSGDFNPQGTTLTLIKPGAIPSQDVVVNKIRIEGNPPWPPRPNGQGPSLQLLDASQDNARVSNWTDGQVWRFASYSANVGSNQIVSQVLLFMGTAGDIYLDDLALVEGSVPAVGPNLLANGDFETPLETAWIISNNTTNTAITNSIAHSGNNSLHLVFKAGGGSAATAFSQNIAPLDTNKIFTVSFWYFSGNGATNLTVRLNSTYRPAFDTHIVLATPGRANTQTDSLPPYPPLWLNEIQPNNATGITDHNGQHDPWIELYNSGAVTLSLDGFYLADNYTDLLQWPFPAGSSINPGEFKIIFADGETAQSTATEWHTNFRLNSGGGAVALARVVAGAPQILDYLNYGAVPADQSYGDFPDGQLFDREVFTHATPGAPNQGAITVPVLFINEWMASNTNNLADPADSQFDDWFELYNSGTSAANLDGYYLTDSSAKRFQFRIPPGYVIPPGGHLLVWADNQTNENSAARADLHVNFQLSKSGEAIGLFAPDGTTIDFVVFGPQTNNISQGRCPDGSANIVFFVAPTPRAANVCPPASPSFESISPAAKGGIALVFPTVVGSSYRVEYKDDLNETKWRPLGGNQPGNGGNLTVIDATLGTQPQRFYRIVLVN